MNDNVLLALIYITLQGDGRAIEEDDFADRNMNIGGKKNFKMTGSILNFFQPAYRENDHLQLQHASTFPSQNIKNTS